MLPNLTDSKKTLALVIMSGAVICGGYFAATRLGFVSRADAERPVQVDGENLVKTNPDDQDSSYALADKVVVTVSDTSKAETYKDRLTPIEGLPNTYHLTDAGSGSIKDKVARAKELPGVEEAEADEIVTYHEPDEQDTEVATASRANPRWGFKRVGASRAWRHSSGSGVKVAVIDTGVSPTHISLREHVLGSRGKSYVGESVSTRRIGNKERKCTNHSSWNDQDGHGTAVSSVIAGNIPGSRDLPVGVAPSADIVPVRVLDCWGYGKATSIAAGIRYAANAGADVINLSLGSPSSCPLVEKWAVETALNQGVTIVASAGNDSKRKIGCPASADRRVIVAGASGSNDKRINHPGFWGSNYGPGLSLVAPGENILAACLCRGHKYKPPYEGKDNYYIYGFNGTSAAAPFIAGAAADVLSVRRGLSPGDVKFIIERSAAHLGNYSHFPNEQVGYGRLNVPSAVWRARVEF